MPTLCWKLDKIQCPTTEKTETHKQTISSHFLSATRERCAWGVVGAWWRGTDLSCVVREGFLEEVVRVPSFTTGWEVSQWTNAVSAFQESWTTGLIDVETSLDDRKSLQSYWVESSAKWHCAIGNVLETWWQEGAQFSVPRLICQTLLR